MPLIYLDYELRREFIIQNYCVNKNRPELECNGKCYLSRRIAAVREQEEKQAEQIFIFKLLDATADCPLSIFGLLPDEHSVICRAEQPLPDYSDIFAFRNLVADIFHPPLS